MDFVPGRGMRIAVSFDEQPPQVLDIFARREAETFPWQIWCARVTRGGVRSLRSFHALQGTGPHTLKIAMVDPGVVEEKIIIGDGSAPESYFGSPEASPVGWADAFRVSLTA